MEDGEKLLKVTVDRMPQNCRECPFIETGWDATCTILKFLGCERPEVCGNLEDVTYRRHDCPLEAEGRSGAKDFERF